MKSPGAVSLSWNNDGEKLYVGYTDGVIRSYEVGPAARANYVRA
jgi:hypothetical protein